MKFIKKNLKVIVILFLLIITICCVLGKIYLEKRKDILKPKEKEEVILEEEFIFDEVKLEEDVEKFFVDLKGAVVKPGVYEIESGKKVIDVVHLAGGLTENADTSLINLAKQVKDEMVIIIYTKEEVEKALKQEEIVKIIEKECVCPEIKNDACLNKDEQVSGNKETSSGDKVNINTATLEELQILPGVGESKAEAIIKYREEHDGFQTIEELKEVSGIGEALFEKVKEYISI